MRIMKRSLSESSNDMDDDVFDDRMKAGSPSQSCSVTDRKKRRGIIEKRRRDRINNSLTELRRLVPSAFEKQVCSRDNTNGSAKLEKAEILQMTVDHLKVLHQKGLNGNYYDPHSLAMDYRSVGYRECAAEVARYLVTVEGMDIQDPLRMRLMSHLQCYSAQRELASKTCQNTTWQTPSQYGGGVPTTNAAMLQQHNHQDQMTTLSPMTSCTDARGQSHHQDIHARVPTSIQSSGSMLQQSNVSISSTPISHSQTLLPHLPQVHSQFSFANSINGMPPVMSPSGGHPNYSPPSSLGSLKQPYRPWGSELIGY